MPVSKRIGGENEQREKKTVRKAILAKIVHIGHTAAFIYTIFDSVHLGTESVKNASLYHCDVLQCRFRIP